MKMVLIITTVVFMILAKILKPESENRYPETGVVVEIYDDTVVVETSTGNIFEFFGAEDWFVGDIVSMIMDSCGTTEITDDMIIAVKYSGVWKK